jgi:ATP-dependent Clp protease ATP-binding subunit ClpC
MFERFTERARQVVVLAQEEARTLKHNYIGTEHKRRCHTSMP